MSKILQRKIFQTKASSSLYLSYIYHTYISVSRSFLILSFCPEHPTLPHSNSFPDQWLFNFNLGSPARKKLSWISRAVSLEVELPRHLGTTIPADLPQDSILRVSPQSPPQQRKAGMPSQLPTISMSLAKSKLCTNWPKA